jgi:Ni,Fe-hydrogenase III small subunit
MFDILRKSLKTGVVTTPYPAVAPGVSPSARGRPAIRWQDLQHSPRAASVCPTGALSCVDSGKRRTVSLDLGLCVFCGLCADADPAIRMTSECELASRSRAALRSGGTYTLNADGTHREYLGETPTEPTVTANLGHAVKERAANLFGRSLHIREVDAGSCNGCEVEIVGLNSPVYDLERFGIHFVASPRHADMLLVTGPVSRNMELALRKTYEATPAPRLVVAAGACGCSGGIFGQNYASLGGVDRVLPVDVYIPGCPPNPHALLHGILLAMDRWVQKRDQPSSPA